jgi:hypothetical protein
MRQLLSHGFTFDGRLYRRDDYPYLLQVGKPESGDEGVVFFVSKSDGLTILGDTSDIEQHLVCSTAFRRLSPAKAGTTNFAAE